MDINCDLGEGSDHDGDLMPLITSANIACGGHAGDADTMEAAVRLARRHGTAVGAHPGFADRSHFGRIERRIEPADAAELVAAQVRSLGRIAERCGVGLHHVKLHGALYNQAARDPALAASIAAALRAVDPGLICYGPPGSALLAAARVEGLAVACEVFADRTYQPDGSLTPRSRPGALIVDATAALAQVLRVCGEGRVRASDGTDIALAADTICLHGDGPDPVAFARSLRLGLGAAGIEVRAVPARC
jgi:UPF0271 protein